MPGQFLTIAERERLSNFPKEISTEDIYTFFTLTPSDFNQIPTRSADYNRLGFSLQLGALRFLGFCPEELHTTPPEVVTYVAKQLKIDSPSLDAYGQREHTRTDHLQQIRQYLGFRKASEADLTTLWEWLLQRALEHDKPTLLFQMATDWLYSQKIVRPGVTILERMVIQVRQQAHSETYRQLNFLISDERKALLDKLLITEETLGRTPLFWLRYGAVANTPTAILQTISKLEFLFSYGVSEWDLSSLNPNRQKFLAQMGRKSTNQALQRMNEQRRYPILLSFLRQSLMDITDELIDVFDRCMSDSYARAKRDNKEFRLKIAKATNEKLILFQEIGNIVLDKAIPDPKLRSMIYSKVTEEELQAYIEECDKLIRPKDDQSIDYFGKRYSYIREFAPQFLDALSFYSNRESDPLILAIGLIKALNATRKRKVQEDAPLAFIPTSWLSYVLDDKDKIVRRYYEISTLWELRSSLRSGDIWVKNSRRYTNPETYLIPKEQWPKLRTEACHLLGLPEKGEERLNQRKIQLEKALSQLDDEIESNENIKIENGKPTFPPLKAEKLPQSSIQLQDLITARLPLVELTDLLIEVDGWTHFTDHFQHPYSNQPRTKDLLTQLYASILAQAYNFGLAKMAQASDLSYDQLAWTTNWYIREETLQEAINTFVNFQYNQALSHVWGGQLVTRLMLLANYQDVQFNGISDILANGFMANGEKKQRNPLASNQLAYHFCLFCAPKLLKSELANSIQIDVIWHPKPFRQIKLIEQKKTRKRENGKTRDQQIIIESNCGQ